MPFLNQLNLITDRTQEDVLLQNSKGIYSADDLNRVESAVKTLLTRAISLGTRLPLVIKTDWILSGYPSPNTPTESQMQRYLENIRSLCQAVALQCALPASMHGFGYEDANSIEGALLLAEKRIYALLSCLRFSGELYSGDEIL